MKTSTKYTLEIREIYKGECLTYTWWSLDHFESLLPSSITRGPSIALAAKKRRLKSTDVTLSECERARNWWMRKVPNAHFRIVETTTIEVRSVFAGYSPIVLTRFR
jgi:hypothetical protein